MSKPAPDMTPEGWSRASRAYEHEIVVRITRPFAVMAVDRLDLRPGDRVIDVACGPGTASFVAADRGASVLAVDYAPDMVARLRERLEATGREDVEAAVMDGTALEVADGSFDAAMDVFGLMFFPDQDAGLREMHRVVRPGSRVAVVTWGPAERNPWLPIQREAAQAVIPDLPAPAGPPAVFSLSDPAALGDRMRAAGLTNVSSEPVPGDWSYETAEGMWDLMGATPIFATVQELAGERLEEVHDVLVRLVAERYGEAPTIPCEAVLAVGERPSA